VREVVAALADELGEAVEKVGGGGLYDDLLVLGKGRLVDCACWLKD